jgi:tRNA 2-selenouridine synthase
MEIDSASEEKEFSVLHDLLKSDTPLLDVRAAVEFSKGAFPFATNIPILTDEERQQVGTCYKQEGSQAATKLGHELVKDDTKQHRIDAWAAFLNANPQAWIYCFRGGQRSTIAQRWLAESGIDVPKIEGGYKALRRSLLHLYDNLPPLVIVAGKTGVGKTILINDLNNSIDLEGRANHRGSAFGNYWTQQPSQIDFENRVAIDLLKSKGTVVLEDEGRLIGKLSLPLPLQAAMKQAPLVLLEATVQERVETIFQDYIVDSIASCDQTENAVELLETKYLDALSAVKKRLGGEAYATISLAMKTAFNDHRKGDPTSHKNWIKSMLVTYYDPMYEYQIQNKQYRIICRGSITELKQYLAASNLNEVAAR